MSTTRIAPTDATTVRPGIKAIRLHGHSLDGGMAQAALAELIGVFLLVLTIITTAIAATLDRAVAGTPYGSLAVPIAGGVALALAVASLGRISGAHLNPAVTMGLALNNTFPWRRVPTYIVAQVAGATGAALTAWALYGDRAQSAARLGSPHPAPTASAWQVGTAEAVVTFLLVFVVVSVAADHRLPAGVAALTIGAALSAGILISGPVSGAGINPARSLGPMFASGQYTDWWIYISAPILGSTVAVAVYAHLSGHTRAGSQHHGETEPSSSARGSHVDV
jgi:MIP family channel proteins